MNRCPASSDLHPTAYDRTDQSQRHCNGRTAISASCHSLVELRHVGVSHRPRFLTSSLFGAPGDEEQPDGADKLDALADSCEESSLLLHGRDDNVRCAARYLARIEFDRFRVKERSWAPDLCSQAW